MDKWDFRLIQVSKMVGITPFEVGKGRSCLLQVRWRSRQGLYFIFVTFLTHLYLFFYLGSVIVLIIRHGLAFSFRGSGWVGAMGSLSFFQWIIIFRHEKIVTHWNSVFKILGGKSLSNLNWQKDKKNFFNLGSLIFGIMPFVMICGHIWLVPGDIYIHSQLIAHQIPSAGDWRLYSNIFHCYSAFLLCGGAFFMDMLLIFFSTGYFRKFEDINENLMLLNPYQSGQQKTPRIYHPNTVLKTISQEAALELKDNTKAWNCIAFNKYLRSHLELQHNLELFNDKFDSLILAFPFQLFVMILALFVSVVRGEMANQLELITFVATGGQYLVRSFIGLLNMGKVHEAGCAAKSILLRDLRIQYEQKCFGPDLQFELESFLSTIGDDVAIKAGAYLVFKKDFVLSYYGALATYMALLVQSF